VAGVPVPREACSSYGALAASSGCGGGSASAPTSADRTIRHPRPRRARGCAQRHSRMSHAISLSFPTLSELDADPNASRQVYEVGYLIGEFVGARATSKPRD